MLEPLAILGTNSDSAFNRLAIHKEGCLLATVLVELNIDHGTIIGVVEDNVDIDGSREEVRHDRRFDQVCCLLPLLSEGCREVRLRLARASLRSVIVEWLGWTGLAWSELGCLVRTSEVGGADVSAGGDRGPIKTHPSLP
jgi:hypothetical protein